MTTDLVIGTPILESVTPPAGPLSGGSQVVVLGDNFPADARVRFGEAPAHLARTFVESPQRLRVEVPRGLAPGPVTVRVGRFGGRSGMLDGAYEYRTVARLL